MKNLIIVGVGGFGREAYYLAKSIGKWNIKGFLGNIGDDPRKYKIDLPVLGVIEDYMPMSNDVFVMGVADPFKKEKFATILKSKGAQFETLVAPTSYVNETTILGEGCVVGGRAWIGDCNKIGSFVHVAGSSIGQDVEIGDYSTTTAHTNIPSGKIGKKVFVGSMAVVLANVEDEAKICAGSIVMRKVKRGTTVFGNPAVKM